MQIELIDQNRRTKATLQNVARDGRNRLAARQMRKHLQKQREHKALKLARILRREGPKLAAALKNLHTVSPIQESVVPTNQLITRIEKWFYANTTPSRQPLRVQRKQKSRLEDVQAAASLDIDRFHKFRKVAKLGRYMVGGFAVPIQGCQAIDQAVRRDSRGWRPLARLVTAGTDRRKA
jgi:CHAD domain-containing protein